MDRTSAGSFRVVGRGMTPKVAAFRRGFATNLHALGVDAKTKQAFSGTPTSEHHGEYLHQERDEISGERDGFTERQPWNLQRSCKRRQSGL
jgi:hypothetical protein